MSKPFRDLRKKLSPEAQAKAYAKTSDLLAAMQLQDIRLARQFSQEELAKALDRKQANISRLERRNDMYISTLRSYIKAMGGELDIVARFPEGDVHINQFDSFDEEYDSRKAL